MNKTERYEQIYAKLSWFFIVMGFTYGLIVNIIFSDNVKSSYVLTFIVFYIMSCILNYIRRILLRKGLLVGGKSFIVYRISEFTVLSYAIIYLKVGQWAYIMIALSALIATLAKGAKTGLLLTGYSFIAHTAILATRVFVFETKSLNELNNSAYSGFILLLFTYSGLVLFVILCGMIHKDSLVGEEENKALVAQLGEKYEQLAVAQDEIKYHYEKLKDTNIKLEETNKKLTSSIAEFYTLQQISQAISSILDIKELLKYVNDIILGVMGVNYSTIIIYDEKKDKLRVHTTNIKNRDELETVNRNINCSILLGALNNGKPIAENFVDPEEYVFVEGREVNSLICVPLITKTRKFGLVLIEHKYFSAFDEENVRLLDIIGQQVGIAMENAELYQKMQDMATIDGLTGVYNRLYFQDRLHKEFKNAQVGNYELSVAIFDIDHFKRFNDTFGHLFGDKVLKTIADLVNNSLRSSDVFARYGGEEFIILFPHTKLDEAYEKVESLRQKISHASIKDNLVTASVTVSFGIACYPENASMENELVRYADDALYEAKKAGRNCVKIANT
ncbi:MAG: GGDEF domain-containing protein [Clostridia bacterium]|nr:GGDEF domain-containing protein [Clostridia bacterium]